MSNWKITLSFLFTMLVILGVAVNLSAAEDLLEKGIAEYKAENYEEALGLLKEAGEKHPESSIVAFYLGLAYKQVENFREAATHFRNAIKLTPPVLDAYTELIEILYNLDELKEAREWITKAEQEGVKPAYIAFLKGLVFLKEDKTGEAIGAFSRAKELDKTLAQASDFQIAMTHTKERKFEKARESLKAVIAVDPTTELAAFAKEYEKAIEKTLELYRPWRFSIGAAYQYDDNPVSADGVKVARKEDSSMVNTFRIDYTPLLKGPWSFNSILGFYTNTYSSTSTHDVITPSISLIPGYNFKDGAVTLPLSYSHVWLHEREYMSVTSAKPALNILLFPGHIGQLSIGYAKREMFQAPINDDEDRDGDVYSAGIGYIYPFSKGKGMFNLRYEYSKDSTDGVNWDNSGNRISTGILIPVTDKINLTLSGDVFLQDYKNTHTAFNVERRDKIYSGSAGLIWEMLKGLNLNLQYFYTRADSNIVFYDYKRNVCMVGIEYRF